MEKRNAIKKTKEDTSKQSIILSEERFVFLSKNKYRKKRNYNEMIKEVEEAQKIYQANLSLTESKPSQSVTKRLGDLDSKDIEEILDMEEFEDKKNGNGNTKEGFRTKILKSVQKEIGLPGQINNSNVVYSEKNTNSPKKYDKNSNNKNQLPSPIKSKTKPQDNSNNNLRTEQSSDISKISPKANQEIKDIPNNEEKKTEDYKKEKTGGNEKTKGDQNKKLGVPSEDKSDVKTQNIDFNKYFHLYRNYILTKLQKTLTSDHIAYIDIFG